MNGDGKTVATSKEQGNKESFLNVWPETSNFHPQLRRGDTVQVLEQWDKRTKRKSLLRSVTLHREAVLG